MIDQGLPLGGRGPEGGDVRHHQQRSRCRRAPRTRRSPTSSSTSTWTRAQQDAFARKIYYGPTNREVMLPAEYAGRVTVGAEAIARLRFPDEDHLAKARGRLGRALEQGGLRRAEVPEVTGRRRPAPRLARSAGSPRPWPAASSLFFLPLAAPPLPEPPTPLVIGQPAPPGLTLANYVAVPRRPLLPGHAAGDARCSAAVVTALAVVLGYPVAYGLARGRHRFKTALRLLRRGAAPGQRGDPDLRVDRAARAATASSNQALLAPAPGRRAGAVPVHLHRGD